MQILGGSIISGVKLYIDPGLGSLVIQILIAGIISGLVVPKAMWQKVKDFFSRLFGRQ